jgi:uncharacterized protein
VKEVTKTYVRIAWCNRKLARRTTPLAGDGLFVAEPIAKDELLVVWGGVIVTTDELLKLPDFARSRAVQVEEDHHLTSGLVDDIADCVNHSCTPTAGLSGQISLVALHDLVPGDEIAFDYAMSDAHPSFLMKCYCGQSNCRKMITGNDWKLPDLQNRYKGYFSPYIQRKINALNNAK